MRKVSRGTAQVDRMGPVEDRHADLDGGYTVNFVTFADEIDGTDLFKGLPNDQCSCPHWGYVFKGQLRFRTDDGDQVFGPGDAFYLPPGHVPVVAAGTEYVQFSPTTQLHVVSEHMAARARQMQEAAPA